MCLLPPSPVEPLWESPPDDQADFGPSTKHGEISPIAVRCRDWRNSVAASRRRSIDLRSNLQCPGQTRRRHGAIVLGRFYRKILHQIMAHIRLHDCLCVPRRLIASVPGGPPRQRRDRFGRTDQLAVPERRHCARTWHQGLSRVGAARENQTGKCPAARMGGVLCVAGRQQATVSSAGTSHTARRVPLRNDAPDWRFSFAVLYAFSSSDLDCRVANRKALVASGADEAAPWDDQPGLVPRRRKAGTDKTLVFRQRGDGL